MQQILNTNKTSPNFSNCLSSCIVNHMERSNLFISEYNLYCNDNMLYLEFNEYESLGSPIENKIIDGCNKMGIELKKLPQKTTAFLDNLLSQEAKIILNIDIKNLDYSKFYKSGTKNLTRHYINIISGEKGLYQIHDPYIPTIPSSCFEGKYKLTNHIINNSTIYSIEVNQIRLINEIERKSNVLKSINSFFLIIADNDPYQLFINSIENNYENSEKLYEIAVSLAVGGALASRELFHKNVLKIIQNNNIELGFQEIQSNYFKLRLLILKLSFSKARRDLENVCKKVKEIKQIEISNYLNIKNILEGET